MQMMNCKRYNKLSLHEAKAKFTLFHKPRNNSSNLPFQLPNPKINNYEIKRFL